MQKRRLLIPGIFLIIISVITALVPTVSFTEDTVLKSEAYTILGENIEEQYMEFIDGMEQGITEATDPLYSEAFEMEGVHARKVYKENYVYFRLDKDFYEPEDRNFIILVEYWDFGPDPGWFHVEYNSADGTPNKRVSIQKTGRVQKWCTARIFVTDAQFGGKMEHDTDIRLVSNAYNAFSKITVYNIDAAKRNGETIDVGVVNEESAQILNNIGLYSGTSETEYVPDLKEELTRYEMMSLILEGIGERKKAVLDKTECTFSDVSKEQSDIIGYAEKKGLIFGGGDEKFRPNDKATPREMLTVYLRLLGYDESDLYENAYDKAYEIGLIVNGNLILSADSVLKRDDFVAAAYNVLNLKNIKTNETVINKMVVDNLIEGDILIGTEFEGAIYSKPVKIEKKTVYDETAQREYYYMNINGARAIRPYVTQQHWKSDGSKFIISNDVHKALYEYDVEKEELKKLDDTTNATGSAEAVVTPYDKIFYRKTQDEYWLMDWNTGETKKVAEVPSGVQTSVMQITDDAKYATGYWLQNLEPEDNLNGVNRYRIVPRLNLETGEWDTTSLHHEFDDQPEFPHLGHAQINPVNPDLMMFCHEGTTSYIHDRIWIGDMTTGESKVLFHQAKLNDELTGETTGHEIWAPDGQSVFFVKYYFPNQNIGQQGVVRVKLDGEREYINGDYRYWHCYPSADNNWVAADTQLGSSSEIVLINTNTYESHVLAKFPTQNNPQHPYQPHPIISHDGRYVSWQMIDENGVLGVGWADISEFTKESKEQETIEISDGITMRTHPDSVSAVKKIEDKDGTLYYQAEPEYGIYCDIDEKAPADEAQEVTLRITYMDNGRQPIKIYYTSYVQTSADLANRENKYIELPRTNTDQWRTEEITLKDMNLSNAGKFKTDFYVSGSIYSNVKVKNIEVVK